MAQFRDLIRDINALLENPEVEISEDGLQLFLENLGNTLRDAFGGSYKNKNRSKERKLVASNLGLPPRRLWFALKAGKPRQLRAASQLNFLYGSILENLILFLAKEAGHEVTEEQKRIEFDGVSGKTDCRIDGVVVDVKSASSFSFKKFRTGEFLLDDRDIDPYGYKYQLGFYMKENNDQEGAFLVVNKENGELVSIILDRDFDIPDINYKIEQTRVFLESDVPPLEKCYPEIPRGKSGNMVLHKICSFCDFRDMCWADANDGKGLIAHSYADGTTYFTHIVKDPQKAQQTNDEQE